MRLIPRIGAILFALCAILGSPAHAQGTLSVALAQQVSVSGQPLAGCLLYTYVVGTVSVPQTTFQDTALTVALPFPLPCDSNGRVPSFYLPSGNVHVRLTDASGNVQFDYPSALVLGGGGGGGGSGSGSVDPSSIAATGDIKFRPTSEALTGWIKLNGQTIGNSFSGATQYANANAQNLFVYLWTNCTQAHCPVTAGRGASALADFQANKQITLPDWRARIPVGLDDMGNTPAGILQALNVTSAGDSVTTPAAIGGEAIHTITVAQMPSHQHNPSATSTTTITDPGHAHNLNDPGHAHNTSDPGHVHGVNDPGHNHTFPTVIWNSGVSNIQVGAGLSNFWSQGHATDSSTTGITINNHAANITVTAALSNISEQSRTTGISAGTTTNVSEQVAGSGSAMNLMPSFMLGTWYMKL